MIASAVLLMLLAVITPGSAQVAPADSLGRDTLYTALPDSVNRVEVIDPVRPYFPTSSPFGSIVPATSPSGARFVSELALASTRYFTAFDALRRFVPAHPLSQGAPGLVRALSYAGASPDAVAVSFNGRPLEGMAAYGYDLEIFPVEYSERAEIVTGARALLYGTGEALMAVNFVQPRLDVEGSYVRTWYA
ncbi:MAG: TonB-dependent receptor plug domain-containing protein, partial [bacterium]|nr:TonB-dependent receptor plug domain-containing protein [Candidatus Kapabacteria bacterium]